MSNNPHLTGDEADIKSFVAVWNVRTTEDQLIGGQKKKKYPSSLPFPSPPFPSFLPFLRSFFDANYFSWCEFPTCQVRVVRFYDSFFSLSSSSCPHPPRRSPQPQKECQKRCQKECEKDCQEISQKECQKDCQKICYKECQKECQEIC